MDMDHRLQGMLKGIKPAFVVHTWTHRRERVIRPGKLYRLFLQGFAYSFVSGKFPQVSRTGSSDGKTEAKRASPRLCSCTSASAEGKNGHTALMPAAYRVPSQRPFCRSK